MTTPIQLHRPAPVSDVVDLCRGLLQRAEAGEITGIAVGFALRDRSISTVYKLGDATFADMNLAIDRLKGRMVDGQ